uniref:Uncharacterized protein n=1 Tax=viral metagenome TaxID=1070528 RepID=A0A6H1ZXS2_9ZZZZ
MTDRKSILLKLDEKLYRRLKKDAEDKPFLSFNAFLNLALYQFDLDERSAKTKQISLKKDKK